MPTAPIGMSLKDWLTSIRKVCGRSRRQKSPVIDLNKQTLEFGDKLEELMANGYLGLQSGFTELDVLDEENGIAGSDKPRVETTM